MSWLLERKLSDDQHHCDAQLHAEPDPDRNDGIEENDCSADHEDGGGVANTPNAPINTARNLLP